MVQPVKKLPAVQETQEMQLRSLGWEDPREEAPLQYSYLENPMDRGAWWATVQRALRVRYDWATTHTGLRKLYYSHFVGEKTEAHSGNLPRSWLPVRAQAGEPQQKATEPPSQPSPTGPELPFYSPVHHSWSCHRHILLKSVTKTTEQTLLVSRESAIWILQ